MFGTISCRIDDLLYLTSARKEINRAERGFNLFNCNLNPVSVL